MPNSQARARKAIDAMFRVPEDDGQDRGEQQAAG
jgi:hypothetical protein